MLILLYNRYTPDSLVHRGISYCKVIRGLARAEDVNEKAKMSTLATTHASLRHTYTAQIITTCRCRGIKLCRSPSRENQHETCKFLRHPISHGYPKLSSEASRTLSTRHMDRETVACLIRPQPQTVSTGANQRPKAIVETRLGDSGVNTLAAI